MLTGALNARYLKIRAYMIVFRRRQSEFWLGGEKTDAYTAKHTKRLDEARKSIKTVHANLLAGSLEDLPFGVLGLVYGIALQSCKFKFCSTARYLFKMGAIAGGKSNLLQMLSVASSFLMLGMFFFPFLPLVPASALLAKCLWLVIRCETIKAPPAEEPDGL